MMTGHQGAADDAAMATQDVLPTTSAALHLPGAAVELIDEVLASHAEWRSELAAVDAAYERWRTAHRAERTRWHGAYVAALDQEEASAMTYAIFHDQMRASMQHRR
jgi:hypothetical protein